MIPETEEFRWPQTEGPDIVLAPLTIHADTRHPPQFIIQQEQDFQPNISPAQTTFPAIAPSRVRAGQRVSVSPDGRHSFVVQKVLKSGSRITLITDQGSPVDISDTDDLYDCHGPAQR